MNFFETLEIEGEYFPEYQDKGFEINEALRRGEKINIDYHKYVIKLVANRDLVLFRGVESAYQYDKFGTRDRGFMSCSYNRDIARSFVCADNKKETCCLLHIEIKAGTEFEMIPIYKNGSWFQRECEVLLLPETKLKIIENVCGYEDGNSYEDLFTGKICEFGFRTFKYDGAHVIATQLIKT